MRIALATCPDKPAEFDDDELLLDALRRRGASAEWADWNDATLDWAGFDRVVVRSPWDYTFKREAFLAWAQSIGDRLDNSAALLGWNSDKTYLGDLAADGLAVVPTTYVPAGAQAPALDGEVVVKPSVSAGGRHTGRFAPRAHAGARELIEAITAGGRTAMVQPYLPAVGQRGETAIVFVAGEPCHALRKRALLAPDEVAPVRAGGGAAEVMYDPDLVRATEASGAELDSARAVIASVTRRFGAAPLYARVDMLADADGSPVLLELETIEPCLYLHESPATAQRLADAIIDGG